MRGVAAIVVVYYHSSVITDAGCFEATCNVRFGFLAVDMFFALSGFVLSQSYDDQFGKGLTPWGFMKKRLVRLLPIHWLGMAIALPLAWWEMSKGLQSFDGLVDTAVLNALVLPSLGATPHPYLIALLRPAWSLFFELWVANLLFALFWRQLRGAGLATAIAVSLAVLVMAAHRYGSLDMGPVRHTVPGGFARVMFSFFVGVALRRLAVGVAMPRLPSPLVVGVTVATFFAPVPSAWALPFELGCVTLAYPLLIRAGAAAIERRARLATRLGDASYALYLIHMPLLDLCEHGMRKAGIAPNRGAALLFVAVAVGLALLVDRLYDPHARRVLARLLGTAARPARGAQPDEAMPAGGSVAVPFR
jgi:peptidoglycan/LPS O-acetylase OafA/YrhL